MEKAEEKPNGSTHTISLLVENKPGVLHRIAGLFSRRGYNIASLTVGPTEIPEYSRMTIVVRLGSKSVEQVVRQVQKLVPVVEVRELVAADLIERELILVKIRTPERNHAELRAHRARARLQDPGSPEPQVRKKDEMATIYYDKDANLDLLKKRKVAVIGY